jgi:heme-degrading monooxygenase HmoA
MLPNDYKEAAVPGIANTPEPPYFAVIFTNLRTEREEEYQATAARMEKLASRQPGYLGFESARETLGISVSYWASLEAIADWKAEAEHALAQQYGREKWYEQYKVRIARVERDYEFSAASCPTRP